MALPEAGPHADQELEVTQEVPLVGDEPTPRRRPGRRVVLWAALGVLVATGAGVGIWLGTSGGSSPSGLQVTTETVPVTSGTMQQTVAASGTIQPAQTENLDFGVSGQVTAVDVTTGQQVTAGQTLATVGTSVLQDKVDAAQETLNAAQARLSEDEASGAAASQVDSDQASVTSAQNSLSAAQADLADATLTSPIAGTVASVDLSVGQQVTGSGGGTGSTGTGSGGGTGSTGTGSGGGTGSTGTGSSSGQVVIVSTGSDVVNTTVDDTEVGQLETGDQAVITPSGSTTPVYGTVSSVGLIASSSSGVASFPVLIGVTGSPSGLYAGTSASVSIIVKQIANATEVPTAAISYTGSGRATVEKVAGGRHVTRDITTGVSVNGETQVTAGLSPGDKVLERRVTFRGSPGNGARSLFGNGSTGRRFVGGFPGGRRFSGSGGFPAPGGTGGGPGGFARSGSGG